MAEGVAHSRWARYVWKYVIAGGVGEESINLCLRGSMDYLERWAGAQATTSPVGTPTTAGLRAPSVMIGWSDTRLQLISGNLFLSPPWKVRLIPQCLPHGGNGPPGSAEARHVSLVPSQEFSGEAGANTAALDRWDRGNLPTGSHRIGILVMIVHLVIPSSGELVVAHHGVSHAQDIDRVRVTYTTPGPHKRG